MKIAVVTTARSEYSLNRWIIKRILDDKDLELQLLVGGSHFASLYGETYKEIEGDGINNFYKIEFSLGSDSHQALSKSVGVATISVAQIFEYDRPDFLLVNGDRYELFAFAIPALLFRIPIGHIGGGEITEGAIDDMVRHSITKCSSLHFVSCEEYARNISLLGEEDWRIHIVGAEGIENIIKLGEYSLEELKKMLDLDLSKPTVLISYHPATAEININPEEQIDILLNALDQFKDLQLIFTAPGVEHGAEIFFKRIESFILTNPERARFYKSLGGKLYLSVLRNVKCIIGNSSSGIIEAPFLKVPTINIGNRQKGRVRAKSVIDVGYDTQKIAELLKRILSDHSFVREITSGKYPFGNGNVSNNVINAIKENIHNKELLHKKISFEVKKDEWHKYF
jgi:GDP/UDP-N,N'-diacetylbacillosamine 2-epimerase (hydrolysing)